MIRDLLIPLSELLFWFTGGELLLNTVWFFVWVIVGAVIMVAPIWLSFNLAKRGDRRAPIPGTIFLITFFPMLLVITSPGIIQTSLMEECLPIETVTVNTALVNDIEVRIRHCRFKANYYDENYGEWQAWAVDRNIK
jgi:hypothetical protein